MLAAWRNKAWWSGKSCGKAEEVFHLEVTPELWWPLAVQLLVLSGISSRNLSPPRAGMTFRNIPGTGRNGEGSLLQDKDDEEGMCPSELAQGWNKCGSQFLLSQDPKHSSHPGLGLAAHTQGKNGIKSCWILSCKIFLRMRALESCRNSASRLTCVSSHR